MATSMGDQKENELKQQGISLSTFKTKNALWNPSKTTTKKNNK
jgi:hypothetical protein